MKNFLPAIVFTVIVGSAAHAQVTTTATPNQTLMAQPSLTAVTMAKEENFDKKYRFGIRATPQPTWFKSGNTGSTAAGSYFGFGFGLVMEKKLSNIIHFSTGIGGDFEGGTINYRNDPTFQVREVIDNQQNQVKAKNNIDQSKYNLAEGNTMYVLKQRQYRSTMITIPLLLKMMTNEYSGFRYFGIFGGEIGIRAALKANDTFYSGDKATNVGGVIVPVPVAAGDLKQNDLMVGKDGSFIPMRVGMNLGLGFEYRIAGSTSLVFSANYFQSFTNLMQKNSDYITRDAVGSTTFTSFAQSYLMRAVRINVGIMF